MYSTQPKTVNIANTYKINLYTNIPFVWVMGNWAWGIGHGKFSKQSYKC